MAGLIRQETFASLPAFSFDDIEQQARTILNAAEAQARGELEQSRKDSQVECEQLRKRARELGFQEGVRAGHEQAHREAYETALEQGAERIKRLTGALGMALTGFERDKRRLLAEAETGLIRLAIAIARRVCKGRGAATSDVALENARRLLDMARHEADLALHVNPADLETLREAAGALVQEIDGLEHVQIKSDDSVRRGGCVLRSAQGTIDAALDTQLDNLARALLGDDSSRETEGEAR